MCESTAGKKIGRDHPSGFCKKLPSHVSPGMRRKRDSTIQRCKNNGAVPVGSGKDVFLFVMVLLRYLKTCAAFIYLACLEQLSN